MNALGRHVILDLFGCDLKQITNTSWLKKKVLAAAKAEGATIVAARHGKARNEGWFAEVIIAESHVIISTFPKTKSASLDAFTCGNTIDPKRIIKRLIKVIKHNSASKPKMILRGIIGDGQTALPHKPADS